MRLTLQQLGMVYFVRDGLVYISSEAANDPLLMVDYYLLLGHCLLAVLTAGLGAVLVPLVSFRKAKEPA